MASTSVCKLYMNNCDLYTRSTFFFLSERVAEQLSKQSKEIKTPFFLLSLSKGLKIEDDEFMIQIICCNWLW